jgi:HTH-type transcriptional regulator/antitoxin HipB
MILAMNKKNTLRTYSLDEVTERYIGKIGTPAREAFENELRIDLIGQAIKEARKQRNLTQEELGKLVGVQKAQISKLENSLTDARFDTIVKVFRALNAKIEFRIELLNQNIELV